MHEFPPDLEFSLADTMFIVSREAAQGLYEDVQRTAHLDTRTDALVEAMSSDDSELSELIHDLINEWEFDDREADYFTEGYALSYRLLSYETNIGRIELPKLSEPVRDGYIGKIRSPGQNTIRYIDNRLDILTDTNEVFVDCLEEYISNDEIMDEDDKHAFFLGAFCVYDVLYQQAKINELMDYSNDAHNGKVSVTPGYLKKIIGRISPSSDSGRP